MIATNARAMSDFRSFIPSSPVCVGKGASLNPRRAVEQGAKGDLNTLGPMVEPARSFDLAAEEYEATRPSYPDELLDLLPVASDAIVLDLGAGTGKLTRVLARRYGQVVAVEPLDGMRGILERVVAGVMALPGSAEQIPLDDASVDAVFTAQAF